MKYWLLVGLIGFIVAYYHTVGGVYKVIIDGLKVII